MGKRHYGKHEDVMAAAEIANQAAAKRAMRKGTCYRSAQIAACTKGADGIWTCIAISANHKGSCNKNKAVGLPIDEFIENPEEGPDVDSAGEGD